MSDVDDLLGPEPEPEKKPKRRGRPPKKGQSAARSTGQNSHSGNATAAYPSVVQALHRPVSITFLSEALGQDRKAVTRKLAELPPVGQHRGNVPLYDFRQALAYLVTPRVDMAKAVRTMRVEDLPPSLHKDVWDAKLKEQKWRQQAGELWQTEDVLEVLGEAFQRLKTTTQLWIDHVADNHALPAPARKELTDLVDALQADLHRTLCEMPKERATASQVGEIEGTELDG